MLMPNITTIFGQGGAPHNYKESIHTANIVEPFNSYSVTNEHHEIPTTHSLKVEDIFREFVNLRYQQLVRELQFCTYSNVFS